MNGQIERIENFDDYTDRLKRKIGAQREGIIFFITEVAKAKETPSYRAFITFSSILENVLYVNANFLLEMTCNDQPELDKFGLAVKNAENQMIDILKKECPNCKLIRGSTNLI